MNDVEINEIEIKKYNYIISCCYGELDILYDYFGDVFVNNIKNHILVGQLSNIVPLIPKEDNNKLVKLIKLKSPNDFVDMKIFTIVCCCENNNMSWEKLIEYYFKQRNENK